MKKGPWPLVTLLCATATAGYICRVNVSIAGVQMMEEFGLNQIQMGYVFSAFLLGYAIFQVPGGMLADRLGASRVLRAAAFCWVLISILHTPIGWGPFGSTPAAALSILLLVRFVLGSAAAPTYPAAAQGVSRWVERAHRGRATGIVIASVGLGPAIAPLLVSTTMLQWGWRTAILISALPAMAVALIWTGLRRLSSAPIQTNTTQESPIGVSRTAPGLRTRSFILLSLSYALQGYVGYIFVSWFYLYLVQERNFDLLRGALLSSLPWILSIISIPLGGWISDRLVPVLGATWGRRTVPVLGLAVSGVFISIGAHTENAVIAALSLALATALVLCVEGPFWATMLEISGSKSGTGGGIMNTGCNIGGLLSPVLTPLIASYIGWEYALHTAAGIAVVAAVLWFGIDLGSKASSPVDS
jgi:ACS family glucarate transporter-like MFS transporter